MATDHLAKTVTDNLEIDVFGTDLEGLPIMERTKALTVNRGGITVALAKKLAPESEIIVSNPLTHQELPARVVGLIRADAVHHVYGIAFLDPSVNLWQINFADPPTGKPVNLMCSRCQHVEPVLLTEIEARIFETKKEVTRYCRCMKTSTIWKHTERRATERRETAPRQTAAPAVETPVVAPKERRRDRRTPMKSTACIRMASQEMVVECEDLSRGGFRFKSAKSIPVGASIEAAAPYSKSGMNIFVSCQIAYRAELPGGLYRHGVAYLKALKK